MKKSLSIKPLGDLAATHKAKTVLLRVALGHTLPGQGRDKGRGFRGS